MCVNRIKYETYRSSPSNLIKIYNCWKNTTGWHFIYTITKNKKKFIPGHCYLQPCTLDPQLWHSWDRNIITEVWDVFLSYTVLYSNLYSSEPWARCSMSFSTLRGISNISYMSLLPAYVESLFVNHEPSDMSFFSFSTFRALWLWGNIMQKACFSYLCF